MSRSIPDANRKTPWPILLLIGVVFLMGAVATVQRAALSGGDHHSAAESVPLATAPTNPSPPICPMTKRIADRDGDICLAAAECQVSRPASHPAPDRPLGIVDDPFGVLSGQIDSRAINRAFMQAGMAEIDRPTGMSVPQIGQAIRGRVANRPPRPTHTTNGRFDYAEIAKSSLLFGTLYDCGKCDDIHANVAGGVVVSDQGLALTNYHVLDRRGEDAKVFIGMSFDGRSHPIEEVLAADPVADVALVRLGGDGPFHPAPLAAELPRPAQTAFVLSHPSAQHYVLTQGIVSRHVRLSQRNQVSHWMEITAAFGAGSSGSGIFNDRGEVIGLVSRIYPLFRNPQRRQPTDGEGPPQAGDSRYVELILRRCVTLEAIGRCFAEEDVAALR